MTSLDMHLCFVCARRSNQYGMLALKQGHYACNTTTIVMQARRNVLETYLCLKSQAFASWWLLSFVCDSMCVPCPMLCPKPQTDELPYKQLSLS